MKGIISLTSWKARIHAVGFTIWNLIQQCPGFHIVLVLSDEEFINKDDDLPYDIRLMLRFNKFELLWVHKNVKSLKKILFTLDKYPDVPVISADDDCLYLCNYAQELYDVWCLDKTKIVSINAPQNHTNGTATLWYPKCFGSNISEYMLNDEHLDLYMHADDAYYENLRAKFNCQVVYARPHQIWITHDDCSPLHNIYGNPIYFKRLRTQQVIDNGGKPPIQWKD